MKREELTTWYDTNDNELYPADEADSVMDAMESDIKHLEELLKLAEQSCASQNERIKELEDENWELKHDMEWNAKQYMERNKGATNVIKKMEARIKELRTTKRALWLARAKEASRMKHEYKVMSDFGLWKKWDCVERKCREKAEEYK